MWQEIFHANREALRASLAHFRTAVGELETLVDRGDAVELQAWIARAKALREAVA
jgi:prephenate dehydrogenase